MGSEAQESKYPPHSEEIIFTSPKGRLIAGRKYPKNWTFCLLRPDGSFEKFLDKISHANYELDLNSTLESLYSFVDLGIPIKDRFKKRAAKKGSDIRVDKFKTVLTFKHKNLLIDSRVSTDIVFSKRGSVLYSKNSNSRFCAVNWENPLAFDLLLIKKTFSGKLITKDSLQELAESVVVKLECYGISVPNCKLTINPIGDIFVYCYDNLVNHLLIEE